MSKKRISKRIKLLLQALDNTASDVMAVTELGDKEVSLSVWIKTGEEWREVNGESQPYDKLGVVVLPKRKHAAMVKAIENIQSDCHGFLTGEYAQEVATTFIKALHNAAAKVIGKEPL